MASELEQQPELETRHYIGLMQSGNPCSISVGPGYPDQFLTGPNEPIMIGGSLVYPVSAEIAAAWVAEQVVEDGDDDE